MLPNFTTPDWVVYHNFPYTDFNSVDKAIVERIRKGLERFHTKEPEVSIVIPAYNEECNLLNTLSSLSELKTSYPTELIVVNNNSTDKTQQLLDACGVKSIFEPRQGISFSRQTGLDHARGKYIISADADSIYPTGWADCYINALKDPAVSCVYGSYSFIPEYYSRFVLAQYEMAGRFVTQFRNFNKEFLNVFGFNFAFRKEDALKVGGYNLTRQRWQDGYMAMMLMKLGRLSFQNSPDALVWTSERRLIDDGGILKGLVLRVKREINTYV